MGEGVGVVTGVAAGVGLGVGNPPIGGVALGEGSGVGVTGGVGEGVVPGVAEGVGDGCGVGLGPPGEGVGSGVGEASGVGDAIEIVKLTWHSGTGLPSIARSGPGAVGATGFSCLRRMTVSRVSAPSDMLTSAIVRNAQCFLIKFIYSF